jgi:hypothetical protein
MSQLRAQPGPKIEVLLRPPESDFAKAAKDVSIVAVVTVIAIILIVVFSVYLIVGFLRGVVDGGGVLPTAECAAWLEARRLGYLGGVPLPVDPATGRPYTPCQAAAQAVADSQALAAGACPHLAAPPPATEQSPYLYYLAALQCAGDGSALGAPRGA